MEFTLCMSEFIPRENCHMNFSLPKIHLPPPPTDDVIPRLCVRALHHSQQPPDPMDIATPPPPPPPPPLEDDEATGSPIFVLPKANISPSSQLQSVLPSHRRLLLSVAGRLTRTAPGSPLKFLAHLSNSEEKGKGTLRHPCNPRFAEMVYKSPNLNNERTHSSVNTHLCNELVIVLIRSGNLLESCKLFHRMSLPNSPFLPDKRTGNIFFSALMRGVLPMVNEIGQERFIEMVSKVYELGSFPLTPPSAMTYVICTLCKDKRTDVAFCLLNSLIDKGATLESPPCNALLTGLARIRDSSKMSVFFERMKGAGIRPDVVTFGVLINNLCRQWKVDEAIAVLESMGAASVKPDVITFNTVVDGLCKVGRPEEALSLSEKMVEMGPDCTPDTITYNSLIGGFFHSGQFEKSWELFRRMGEEGAPPPNVVTLNTMVDGMCRHGRVSSAVRLVREMSGNGVRANVRTYTCLIRAFCDSNNIGKAVELFTEMGDAGCPADALAYHALMFGLTRAGRMEEADDVLLKMKEAGFSLDLVGYNTLIGGFCRKNKVDRAYGILKEMEEVGVAPDNVTHNTLISYFSKRGDMGLTVKLLEMMKKERLIPTVVTYGAVIGGYCRLGALDEAMRIFDDMSSGSNVMPNTAIFNTVIDSHCREGKVEAALSLLADMRAKGVKVCTNTYNAIFKGLKEGNMLGKTLELMDAMTEDACIPDYVTMGVLTEWLSMAGESRKLKCFFEGRVLGSAM